MATNLNDSAKYILEISSNRYKIEACFRVMKTNFSARPVFHQKRERIVAHFMICYTALLIYRLLEKKLDMYVTHFTVDSVIKTLSNIQVANLEDVCYMSIYNKSQVLTALNAIMDLRLDKKYYQPKDLNKKIQPRRFIQHFLQRRKKWLKPCKYRVLSHFSTIQLLKMG